MRREIARPTDMKQRQISRKRPVACGASSLSKTLCKISRCCSVSRAKRWRHRAKSFGARMRTSASISAAANKVPSGPLFNRISGIAQISSNPPTSKEAMPYRATMRNRIDFERLRSGRLQGIKSNEATKEKVRDPNWAGPKAKRSPFGACCSFACKVINDEVINGDKALSSDRSLSVEKSLVEEHRAKAGRILARKLKRLRLNC